MKKKHSLTNYYKLRISFSFDFIPQRRAEEESHISVNWLTASFDTAEFEAIGLVIESSTDTLLVKTQLSHWYDTKK